MNKRDYLLLLTGLSTVILTLIYWNFYSPYERMRIYILVVILVGLSIVALFIFAILSIKKHFPIQLQTTVAITFLGFNFILLFFSYYQFNYVMMPQQFFVADPFPIGYEYEDFRDEVRIEYFARDYYGQGEIYRESYDKDEIMEFLEFFRNLETRTDYEDIGSPDIFMDWENDIHVMIRNMDGTNYPDSDIESGYYVMSIDLVDTSNYTLKVYGNNTIVFYEVSDELRDFIEEHLLLQD